MSKCFREEEILKLLIRLLKQIMEQKRHLLKQEFHQDVDYYLGQTRWEACNVIALTNTSNQICLMPQSSLKRQHFNYYLFV